MRRNPDSELDALKQQFLLGDTSIADSLWQALEAHGKLPPIYQRLMFLFGENPENFNNLSAWVHFLNARATERHDIIFLIYSIFIAYASAAAAVTYYQKSIELVESFPLTGTGWQPQDDIRWREVLSIAKDCILNRLNAKDFPSLTTPFAGRDVQRLNDCITARSYLPATLNAVTQYRNLTYNEAGRSYVSRLYPTTLIDSDVNSLNVRQKTLLRGNTKAVCQSSYKLLESMVNSPYTLEPDWGAGALRSHPWTRAPLRAIFIDIGNRRLQDIDELTYSHQHMIPVHLDYAYDSYIGAVQAFTTDVLSVEDQAKFDQIWRSYLKELMLLLWFSAES